MTQSDLLSETRTRIAVVGATDSPGKFGGIIYRFLRDRGYDVVAVNPNRSTVAGDAVFPNLTAIPEPVDIVNLVIPATEGKGVVDEVSKLGWPSIWFQPGAYDQSLVDRAAGEGLDVVAGDCIMVEARRFEGR